jgi:hypothetical protein
MLLNHSKGFGVTVDADMAAQVAKKA